MYPWNSYAQLHTIKLTGIQCIVAARTMRFLRKITVITSGNILGRWKLEACQKALDLKIDYANTDNCGTCTLIIKNEGSPAARTLAGISQSVPRSSGTVSNSGVIVARVE